MIGTAYQFTGSAGIGWVLPRESSTPIEHRRSRAIPALTAISAIASAIMVAMRSASRKSGKGLARVISSKTVFQGPVFRVVSDQVEEPDGVRARRDVVRHSGSIVILAVDQTNGQTRVLLERQYRYAAGARLWELPAGRVDPGEDNLEAARRELLEETGFTARKWRKALFFYVSPGFLDESMEVFLAQDLKRGLAQPEEDERIAIRFFPLAQAVRMTMQGKIKDAKTIASLLWLDRTLAGSR